MRSAFRLFILFVLVFSVAQFSLAGDAKSVRFTAKDFRRAQFENVLAQVNAKTGFQLTKEDFLLFENRALANTHFEMWLQMSDGIPLKSRSIRIWKKGNLLVQAEALVESEETELKIRAAMKKRGLSTFGLAQKLNSQRTMELTRLAASQNLDDKRVFETQWRDEWQNSSLVRVVKAKGRRGYHKVELDVVSGFVLKYNYQEFPQTDGTITAPSFELPARVYPIYEEAEGVPEKTLERLPSKLRNLNMKVHRTRTDIYEPLRTRRYWEDQYDPILGEFPSEQAKGVWSGRWLKERATALRGATPLVTNNFQRGMILDGKYVTINLHPDVAAKFPDLNFEPQPSVHYHPNWTASRREDKEVWEMIPGGSLLGRPLTAPSDVWNRPAQRLADHDPKSYINDGFDEVQVYWAVDTFMTSLHKMGFSDPEISTRPFHAFLYDPDISMKDNAYYSDDTINFTTYSPKSQNFARDNSTIWHELGHGIMDRLMGDYITLADTGGLSEGMADYLAQLLVQLVSKGKPFDGSDKFRIMNNIGFHLTNEVHDDGEAYGGSMNDFMVNAIKAQGEKGLIKAADLTLEAMRLTRNHPGLTAKNWFEHMYFADELGSRYRRAGEMKNYLTQALAGRNFRFDDKMPAQFSLFNGEEEVTDTSSGSRGKPIPHTLKAIDKVTYNLNVKLTSSDTYKFVYPVQVRVGLEGGPLQGAIKWEGQERQPLVYTLNSEADSVNIPLTAYGKCDESNREDGSCVDFAYIQIWNAGETKKPVAKKRFYLRITTEQ
ncbi:MAG: hypothetical protein AB7F59_08610 [Bdellovibrionales bacterium]